MKKILATVAGTMAALSAFGQGQIYMYNNNPIDDASGAGAGPASGGTYQAELVIDSGIAGQVGPVLIAESISPVNSGYFSGPGSTGIFDLDGAQGTPVVAPGTVIAYQIEAWDNTATYAAARITLGAYSGISTVSTYTLGGGSPPTPPAALSFATFQVGPPEAVPEPTTFAIGAMGLGAVLMFRRRK